MFLRDAALTSRSFAMWLVISAAASPRAGSVDVQRSVAKTAIQAKSSPANRYAGEPYVFERHSVTVRFENDGTEERDLSVRVRVQGDEGADRFRRLVFGYISPNEQVSVRSATIRKPDGGSINVLAAPKSTKESTTPITREFPAYGNLRELRLLAPSLRAGDVLEYDVVTRVIRPFATGQFWFQYSFVRDAVVLDERLELDLPRGRKFSIRAPNFSRLSGKANRAASARLDGTGFVFTQTVRSGRVILRWTHANLTRASSESQDARNRSGAPPDIALTSFENWNAVGHWYAQFEKGSSHPSPQIRAKAQELVGGVTNGAGKARAICAYVSQHVRDVNPSDSFGRLAPRSAESVLAEGYGDSDEKAALLAAMLEAAGIRSNAVLIPFKRALDAELPSPGQFDRVITTFADGPKAVWIDSSIHLAPFGFLPAALRGKSALLIGKDGTGTIVETPADPPFESVQNVTIDGQLSELGKLSGTVRYSLRGDTEYVLRTAFHRAPRAEWNQLGQTILKLDGLSGEVTSVTTSDPLDTESPFLVTIAFSDSGAFAWPMERTKIALPLLTIAMPDPPGQSGQPVKLGSPLDVQTHLRLRFPRGFVVHPPTGIAVARDYAEFKSSYRLENSELIAERALNFKARELPASGTPDYLAFMHAVQADEAQTLPLENPAGAKAEIPASASPDDLIEAGATALKSGDTRGAIPLLQRAAQLQSQHKDVWNDLGLAYMQARKFEKAAAAFRKQTEVSASDESARDYLGVALLELHREDDAADAFRKQIELQPLDPAAHAQLGNILLAQRRYSDAVPELEKATVLSPENAELEVRLGRAYVNIGDRGKALASFQKAMSLSSSPAIRNEAAFSLADQGIDLEKAREFAESAIHRTAADLEKADVARPTPTDWIETNNIGAYWDTLGWVYFRKGDLARAERYVRAAWLLTQDGEVGDHLAQIYEKAGSRGRAIHQCALALAAANPSPDARARLILMLGGNAQIDDLVKTAGPQLEKLRTFAVPLPVKEKASADFLIAMSPGGTKSLSARITATQFVNGDESLRRFANELKAIDFREVFPDATQMKLIRRATITCTPAGACELTLLAPEDARARK
jgi:Flp pilus assembly protein TadD/transglutaminase-like putative cysteine protease